MNVLLRLRVRGSLVSIIETNHEVGIEIHGPSKNHPEELAKIHEFLQEEGIMDAVLAGEPKFAEQLHLDASDIAKLTRKWEKPPNKE